MAKAGPWRAASRERKKFYKGPREVAKFGRCELQIVEVEAPIREPGRPQRGNRAAEDNFLWLVVRDGGVRGRGFTRTREAAKKSAEAKARHVPRCKG